MKIDSWSSWQVRSRFIIWQNYKAETEKKKKKKTTKKIEHLIEYNDS